MNRFKKPSPQEAQDSRNPAYQKMTLFFQHPCHLSPEMLLFVQEQMKSNKNIPGYKNSRDHNEISICNSNYTRSVGSVGSIDNLNETSMDPEPTYKSLAEISADNTAIRNKLIYNKMFEELSSEDTDWYSFGTIVYYLFTGHLPYKDQYKQPGVASPQVKLQQTTYILPNIQTIIFNKLYGNTCSQIINTMQFNNICKNSSNAAKINYFRDMNSDLDKSEIKQLIKKLWKCGMSREEKASHKLNFNEIRESLQKISQDHDEFDLNLKFPSGLDARKLSHSLQIGNRDKGLPRSYSLANKNI